MRCKVIGRQLILSLGVVLSACTGGPSQLDMALQKAGENRGELERVIAHYDSLGDEERQTAAKFLIENMFGCGSAVGKPLERFYTQLDSVYNICNGEFKPIMDFYDSTLTNVEWSRLRIRKDLETISADYLIRNIDQAFEVRESPFLRNLSFEEFCETILPYRQENEMLEDWRTDYRGYFAYATDSIDCERDSAIYDVFWKMTQKYRSHNYTKYPAGMPSLKPSFLRRSMIAPCSDFCKLGVFWGRAVGVPVVRDFIPQWANYPNRHEWNAVLWKGKSVSFMIGERNYLGDHLRKCSNIMTKVYRHRYAFQSPKEVAPAYYTEGDVPPFFRNPKMVDVTREYWPVIDVEVCDLRKTEDNDKYLYLTVFDNKDWSAVAWAEKKGDRATFRDVAARPALYLPAYYRGGQYISAGDPICVRADSSVTVLKPDVEHRRTVTLWRKYYEMRVRIFLLSFTGSRIQAANRADFSDAVTYVIPDSIGTSYQDWEIGGKYRYVRFVPVRGKECGLAELEVYDAEGEKVEGRLIGKCAAEAPYAKENIVDGQELSYTRFSKTDTTEWLGLDLGRPTELSRVSYLSRNDGNFIVEGNEYELFYWDGGWKSLGSQTGSRKTQRLVYDNVPEGALLLLRNHTKGKEERIFTYEGGKQVWW